MIGDSKLDNLYRVNKQTRRKIDDSLVTDDEWQADVVREMARLYQQSMNGVRGQEIAAALMAAARLLDPKVSPLQPWPAP